MAGAGLNVQWTWALQVPSDQLSPDTDAGPSRLLSEGGRRLVCSRTRNSGHEMSVWASRVRNVRAAAGFLIVCDPRVRKVHPLAGAKGKTPVLRQAQHTKWSIRRRVVQQVESPLGLSPPGVGPNRPAPAGSIRPPAMGTSHSRSRPEEVEFAHA